MLGGSSMKLQVYLLSYKCLPASSAWRRRGYLAVMGREARKIHVVRDAGMRVMLVQLVGVLGANRNGEVVMMHS